MPDVFVRKASFERPSFERSGLKVRGLKDRTLLANGLFAALSYVICVIRDIGPSSSSSEIDISN